MHITLSDIKNIAEYEKIRLEHRKKMIELKRQRRVSVGPNISFVFENHHTVLYQIQEMMRTERLVHDEHIQHEIDTYSQLLPGDQELSATMLLEITQKELIRPMLDSMVGMTKHAVYLRVNGEEIPTTFDEDQAEDGRISAVQYVRWPLSQSQTEAVRSGEALVEIVIRHPNYTHTTSLTAEQRKAISEDV